MVASRHPRREAWLLVLFSLSLAWPAQARSEGIGHEFIPPEHWSYPTLARFEALGLCRLPSERPYSRDDVIQYAEEIADRVAERGVELSARDRFDLERLQMEFASPESRADPKARFDPPALFASDGPVHLEGDLDVALAAEEPAHRKKWDFFGVAHPVLRLHLGRSFTYDFRYRLVMGPERDGRERNAHTSPRERSWRGLTSLYERAYLVYYWKQGTIFFGRDYADWGPAENRNVILSHEAGSLDKLGGRLRFKSLRLSVIHAILSSPDERYLSGHRLEGTFGRFTAGLSETVIHRDRFLDPVYILPFSSFYANQFSERSDDNVIWGVDLKVRLLDHAVVDGSLLIDDFQYERGDSTPDKLAFNVGARTDLSRPVPLTVRLRYRYVDIYTYTHRDSLKGHVTGSGDPNAGDNLLGVAEGPDTDLLTASVDCYPLRRMTATVLFSLLRRGEGNDFRGFHPSYDHAPPFPSGVVERTTSVGVAAAWEFDGNSLATAEFVRSRVENLDHVSGADEWRNAARIFLRWNL